MRTGTWWWVATLLSISSLHAQNRVVDGLTNLVSATDRGSERILLDGLPASNDLRVRAVAGGPWERKTPTVNPVRDGSFITSPYFTQQALFSSERNRAVAHYRARAVDDGPVDLRIVDQTGRVHCATSSSAGRAAVCTLSVFHRDFPLLNGRGELLLSVQVESRGLGPTPLVIEGFFEAVNTPDLETELQVDPVVRPNGEATATWPINLRTVRPGFVDGDLVEVFSGDTLLRRFAVTQRWDGSTLAANMALLADELNNPGEVLAGTSHRGVVSHRRLNFLLPANIDSADVRISSINTTYGVQHADGTPHDIELQLFHVPGDAVVADVTPLSVDRSPDVVVNSNTGSNFPSSHSERVTLSGTQLKPGRWYAVPVSRTGIPLNVSLTVSFPRANRRLEPLSGHYYNPSRSGHGFYLGKGGDQWVMIWYTYDNDGQPVWYYAQGKQPSEHTGGSQWTATLYRNVWNGSSTRFQFAGWVQLAAMAENRLVFAHLVDGKLGIEPVERLGGSGCSQQLGGQALDVNGLWYSPQKSGYGFSAEVIRDVEFYLAYAYDQLGRPRWATAQQSYNASSTPALLQVQGFCPTCSYTPVTRTEAGSLNRSWVMAATPDGRPGFGQLGIDARWVNGVPGGWNENLPTALLTARTECQ